MWLRNDKARFSMLFHLFVLGLMLSTSRVYGETKNVTVSSGSHESQAFYTAYAGENHSLHINKASAAPNIASSRITSQDTQDQVIWAPAQIATPASTHTYTMNGAQLAEPLWVEIEGTFVKAGGSIGVPSIPSPDFNVTVTAIKVELNLLSAGPQGGSSATRFANNVASGPIAINGTVTVTPSDQVNNVALRLAHNVKTLRQFASAQSSSSMFQISSDGAWMKDGDSTMNTGNTLPGILIVNGADEPGNSYWTGGSFSHPLHIVESHRNFLQYRILPSGGWITVGVVEWGWTADVNKDGETISTSGTIQGGMGYASSTMPITSPDIANIPATSIPPIN